jgi:MFS family permease
MQFMAVNWHIYVLTHSAFALGLVGLARVIPVVIFSFITGIVADRYNRKTINMIVQIVSAVLSLILAVFTLMHKETIFLIYAITCLMSIAAGFEITTRQSLAPRLVDRKDLGNAMNVLNIVRQASVIAGPAFAGFLIAYAGVGSSYLINAISFFAVIIALICMKESGNVIGVPTPFSFGAIQEGITLITSKTILWSTILLDFLSNFFSGATALMPIFAKDILVVGPQGLGLLYAAPSIGAVIAATLFGHVLHKKQGKILLISIFFYAIGTIIFGISKTFLLSLFALAVVGAGDSISTIIRSTIRQMVTPDYLRGRMTALVMIFVLGGPQLGDFEAGSVAALLGAPFSVMSGGIATVFVLALVAWKIPALRKYDEKH